MWFLWLSAALSAPIDFDDAVAEALTSSPSAVVVEAAESAALGEAQTVGAPLANPELEVERVHDETELRASLPIPIAGQPIARVQAAAALRRAARARGEAGRAELAGAVGDAYLDAVRAEELARVTHDSLADAERARDAAVRLFEAGELSRVDRAVTEAIAAGALADALRTEQDAVVAKLRLEALLGREPTGAIELAGWPTLDLPDPTEPDELPAVRAADADAQAARAERTLAWMDRVPTPALTAGQVLHADHADAILGVAIEIPLFAPGIGEVRTASAEARMAEAEAERARLDARADLIELRQEAETAERAWQAAAAVSDLEEALRDIAAALEVGEFDVLDYTTRRESLLEAVTIAIDARYRREAARLALWELVGRVPEASP